LQGFQLLQSECSDQRLVFAVKQAEVILAYAAAEAFQAAAEAVCVLHGCRLPTAPLHQILAVAGLSSSVRQLLDVGCGVGGTSTHIAQKLGCKALGVNISPEQVASANRLALQQGLLPSQVK
jgi:tRNA/tmRNA/rRNA uracil-C5-methylase (TrmA/RlmC/RlmD family)